jgi:hypothetical protein
LLRTPIVATARTNVRAVSVLVRGGRVGMLNIASTSDLVRKDGHGCMAANRPTGIA